MGKFILTLQALLIFTSITSALAQKLPDVQENNQTAPAQIRIDGKNLEWNDTFLALNKRTQLSYTISNDKNNLYLAIKTADAATINKIIAGGISFAINTEGKKKDKGAAILTYPLIKQSSARGQGRSAGFGRGQGGNRNSTGNQLTAAQRDSMAVAANQAKLSSVKEIKTEGFKLIIDSLISIYNEYGIKAFASINNKGIFFYELAIPLKQAGLSLNDTTPLAYNIKLNGLETPGFGEGGGFGGGRNRSAGRPGGFGGNRNGAEANEDLRSATDFWGKYTLAK